MRFGVGMRPACNSLSAGDRFCKATFRPLCKEQRSSSYCWNLFSDRQRWLYSEYGHELLFGFTQWNRKAFKEYAPDDFLLHRHSHASCLFAFLFGLWPKWDLGCSTDQPCSCQSCSYYDRDSSYKEERNH